MQGMHTRIGQTLQNTFNYWLNGSRHRRHGFLRFLRHDTEDEDSVCVRELIMSRQIQVALAAMTLQTHGCFRVPQDRDDVASRS